MPVASTPRLLPGWLGAARAPLFFGALVVVQLIALRRLEYSQARLVTVSMKEAGAPREPLKLGGLNWDPAPYAAAPSLAPLRALAARCRGLSPVATADCLSDLFADSFPHGRPTREFFEAAYSPAQDLAQHMAGAPGHCVTRSGLLVASLLAAGIPARVVQLLPPDRAGGHNVAEVWDSTAKQWVLVDPTYRLVVEGARGLSSAAAALVAGPRARWQINNAGRVVPQARQQDDATLYSTARRLVSGHLIYPDPWLYTRVGRPSAPAPFQGRFVVVGPRSFQLGLAQPLLQGGTLLALLALVASLLTLIVRRSISAAAPFPRLPARVVPLSPRTDSVESRSKSAVG
jgi:hypothetical protein